MAGGGGLHTVKARRFSPPCNPSYAAKRMGTSTALVPCRRVPHISLHQSHPSQGGSSSERRGGPAPSIFVFAEKYLYSWNRFPLEEIKKTGIKELSDG